MREWYTFLSNMGVTATFIFIESAVNSFIDCMILRFRNIVKGRLRLQTV